MTPACLPRTLMNAPAWLRNVLITVAAAGALALCVPHVRGEQPAFSKIGPLLVERCGACHGETRQRGGLALHTPEAIAQGGESGPVFVAGKPGESEILRRLRLPLDDMDHMPPEGKPQLNDEEIRAIEAWVQAGARFGSASADAAAPATPAPAAPPASAPAPAAAAVSEPQPAPLAAINALRDHFVHVEAVAAGSNRLRINFAAAARSLTEAKITALLEPVLAQIESLSLARSAAGDDSARLIGRAPRLVRLDVRGSQITDAGVAALAGIQTLRELVLSQTRITDAAAGHLAAFSGLHRVYVWKTSLSTDAVTRLRQQRPQLQVDVGDSRYATTQAVETDIQLTSDAPLPGQPAPAPASAAPTPAAPPAPQAAAPAPAASQSQPAALQPVNAACPVSGKPVDPRYALVHEGRVIGFCCPRCPGQFWSDPAKFKDKLAKK